jgi:hypothetical protein
MGGAAKGDNFLDAIFENPGFGALWIQLRCVGKATNRAAIGARIRVTAEGPGGTRTIHRVVSSRGSFGASTLRAEIGLGDCERVRELEVVWPGSRSTERFGALEVNNRYVCVEGEGRVRMAE